MPGPKVGATSQSPAPFSLSLDHPKLGDALRAVAAKAGMKVKVEAFAVSLVPPGENIDQFLTAEVQVSPDYFGQALESSGAGDKGAGRSDLREFLMKKGVTFPPGSSATYVWSSRKLVVRETGANIDVLKKLFDQPGVEQK